MVRDQIEVQFMWVNNLHYADLTLSLTDTHPTEPDIIYFTM